MLKLSLIKPPGLPPEHQWSGTSLRFKLQNGTWGDYVDLKGVKGDMPAHRWVDNSLQFQNPDGSWGSAIDLTGPSWLKDGEHLYFGDEKDIDIFTNGLNGFMDLKTGISNFFIRDGLVTKYTFAKNGDFTAAGNVTGYSDIRIKTNIKPIMDGLKKVLSLGGVLYDRTDIEAPRQTGLIAQAVQRVLPEAVIEVPKLDEDGNPTGETILTVAYGNLAGLFVEAFRDLNRKVVRGFKQVRRDIGKLRNEITEIKKRLDALENRD